MNMNENTHMKQAFDARPQANLLRQELRPALLMLATLTLVTGLIYPLVVTGVAQVLFPHQAGGSIIEKGGKAIGSSLIGQPFDAPKYFWSRLSATGPFAYNAGASSGSNYGPLNDSLKSAVEARVAALREADPEQTGPIPVDLITASSSGLDPHISPAAAYYQIARVARVRGLNETTVRQLVDRHVEGRQLGFLGEPTVNVLELNLALDEVRSAPAER
jgi:K+-transporting ATPase ATPase C chain